MATDERKQMLAAPNCKKQSNKGFKILINLNSILKEKNSSYRRAVLAALKAISTTRKTGRISDSRERRILEELSKYPPDVVEYACDWYVEHECANDGKKENYLIAIARNRAKQQEIKKKISTEASEINPDLEWRDGNRVYPREDLERWRAELVQAWEENRPTNPQRVGRVNRCMNDRPNWDWK